MAPRQTAYSFINVAVTLDRRNVEGLWDGDDAVTVTQGADIGTGLVGADGSSIFSVSADRSATITLNLQHTSPINRFLHQKMKQMQAKGANATAFPFSVKDKVSGEGGSAHRCFIQTAPEDQKGKAATVRTWVLWTGDWSSEVPN